jgi:hypothetical protein
MNSAIGRVECPMVITTKGFAVLRSLIPHPKLPTATGPKLPLLLAAPEVHSQVPNVE